MKILRLSLFPTNALCLTMLSCKITRVMDSFNIVRTFSSALIDFAKMSLTKITKLPLV